MSEKTEILAIIPARGGSKRLPGKNLKKLYGLPLIAHSINHATGSKLIDRTIVSTNDLEISDTVKSYGIEVIDRPNNISQDESPTTDAVNNALETLERKYAYNPGLVVILQPTSPFRTSEDIDEALETMLRGNFDSVVSVKKGNPFWHLKKDGNRVKPVIDWKYFKNRIQDLPQTFTLNGAIYIVKPDFVRSEKSLFSKNMGFYEMPVERSMDIDTEFDFRIAEALLQTDNSAKKEIISVTNKQTEMSEPCFLTAEAGVNHNADVNKTKKPEWKLNLFRIFTDKKDIEAVSNVLSRGNYWATGPEVNHFENEIAKYLESPHVLAFNSGTSALQAMLEAYEVKGKEVIVPSFTFIATVNAVLLAGGIPVFAESETETFGLSAQDVEKRITANTRAILSFHYGGFPSKDIVKLKDIADKYELSLLEDAAQAFGAKISGNYVGTHGESSIFSLCQNKILTTGEGGLLVTKSEEIYEKCKLLRSHGRVEDGEDYFSTIGEHDYIQAGYNFRMPSICAALGISQLNKVPDIIRLRRERAGKISEKLSGIKEISLTKEIQDHFSVYQMYSIFIENEILRNKLQEFLKTAGIMSKVYFHPVHLKTLYRNMGFKQGDLPVTEDLAKHILTLPLFPSMEDSEIKYLTDKIREFF